MTVRKADLDPLPEPVGEEPPPTPPDPLKPGFLTSEGWLAIGASVAGIAVAVAPLFNRTPDETHAIADAIKSAAAHIGGLVVVAVSVWQYVKGRSEVKAVAAAARQE